MGEIDEAERAAESTPHVSFVPDGQPISVAVIEAVAAVSGRPPLADGSTRDVTGDEPLDPLYETIDPDALDTICSSDEDSQTATSVTFTYCGYDVTVESTGQITVSES